MSPRSQEDMSTRNRLISPRQFAATESALNNYAVRPIFGFLSLKNYPYYP